MIDSKDRGQILRMAGNIASGMVSNAHFIVEGTQEDIENKAVEMAFRILRKVDKRLEQRSAQQ